MLQKLLHSPLEMASLSTRSARLLKVFGSSRPTPSGVVSLEGCDRRCHSTVSLGIGKDGDVKHSGIGVLDDDFVTEKPDLQPQRVDPRKGRGFRGVHKAIICGRVGQAPVQKILRNGQNVTIFTVGTGGMFDQRIVGSKDLPRPAQWHRIAVHNPPLGNYAVQQLSKNSSVYVEGEIETRVYNDSINGEVKNIPEICVRRDGKIRVLKTGENFNKISFDELREELL